MSSHGSEFEELFLQEASEHLQVLREYASALLDSHPANEAVERLYVAAHTLKGSSAMYGYPLFSAIAAKLDHAFQYVANIGISPEAATPLVEFISEAAAVLEADLLMVSEQGVENVEELAAFRQKYSFAFQETGTSEQSELPDMISAPEVLPESPEKDNAPDSPPSVPVPMVLDVEETIVLPPDSHVGPEILEFFVPEAEEHFQTATACLLALETNPNRDDVNRLFRAMHTLKGAAAQVGLSRIAWVAHRAEDLICRLRDKRLQPSAEIVDLCLDAIDVLKKFVYRQWPDEETVQSSVQTLLGRMAHLAPAEEEEGEEQAKQESQEDTQPPRGDSPAPDASVPQVPVQAEAPIPWEGESYLYTPQQPAAPPASGSTDIPPAGAPAAMSLDEPALSELPAATFPQPASSANAELETTDVGMPVDSPAENALSGLAGGADMETSATSSSASEGQGLSLPEEPAPAAPDILSQPDLAGQAGEPALAGGEANPASQPANVAASTADDSEEEFLAMIEGPAEATGQRPGDPVLSPLTALPDGEPASGLAVPLLQSAAQFAADSPPAAAMSGAEDSARAELPSHPAIRDNSGLAGAPAGAIPSGLARQAPVSPPVSNAHIDSNSNPTPAKSVPGSPTRTVRIPLDRLDRMMNSVGELVINRTRMLGRLAELEQLTDTLNFSKARMADKVVEFQDKYEFGLLQSLPIASGTSPQDENRTKRPAARPQSALPFPYRSGYSSYSHTFDAALAEFSELELDRYDDFNILSRSLTEISADIGEIVSQLDAFVRRVDGDIDEFKKLSHRLQDEITKARRLPIAGLFTRLSRTAREAARTAGKQVVLELEGTDTELDSNILQQIADPLLHLVRNAVAHGIEGEEERYQLGKPDHGKVAVRANHHDGHIYIEVEDDGRGIDWEQVRATAVHFGLTNPADAANLTQAQLQELLFQPGFSTTLQHSELAGRGVGLDVVRTNVNGLKGEVEIETQRGMGTRFTLKIPLTRIIAQALFVRSGKQVFALPLACVQEVRRIHEKEMETAADGKLVAKVRDTVTELVRIDQQLGLEPFHPAHGYYILALVNVAGRSTGIVVEEVLRKDEVVVKDLGEYLRNVKLFAGATVAPDGSLILLLDVERLCAGEAVERRPLMTSANAAGANIFGLAEPAPQDSDAQAAPEQEPEVKIVLLADDSISVRKFVGRMLEKAGYRVELAADGLEAIEILGQTRCNLVITDLEMPRTNGYELMAHLRQDPATRDIPVMVVTSRAGAKHRERALRQGAAEFLVKPVQEEQFITAVSRLLAGTKAAAGPLEARA